MHARLVVVTMLVTVGCREKAERPAPTPPPPVVEAPKPVELLWTTRSADGKATLELRKTETCRMVCSVGETEAWAVDGCVVDAKDFRFVSGDCKTAVVLFPQPVRANKYVNLVLARAWRDGKPKDELTDHDLGLDSSGSRFRWLGGAVGEFGEKPRYVAEGREVEYQLLTASGRETRRLPLDGAALVPPPDAGRPAR